MGDFAHPLPRGLTTMGAFTAYLKLCADTFRRR
jgi:hypothetical protein